MDVKKIIVDRHTGNDGKSTAAYSAEEITKLYAGSANAHPASIPGLYHDLVTLFSTGELPRKK